MCDNDFTYINTIIRAYYAIENGYICFGRYKRIYLTAVRIMLSCNNKLHSIIIAIILFNYLKIKHEQSYILNPTILCTFISLYY